MDNKELEGFGLSEGSNFEDKTHNGTFLSSVFTCVNSAVGLGILTLPYAFASAGIGVGAVLLCFYGGIMALSVYSIVVSAQSCGASNYQQIVTKLLGPRMGNVMKFVIFLYCVLCCTGGLIIVADSSQPLLLKYSGCNCQSSDTACISSCLPV